MKALVIVALIVVLAVSYIFTAPVALFTDNPHIFTHTATVVVSNQEFATHTAHMARSK